MLNTVDGTAQAIVSIKGVTAKRLGNMSERADLLGDVATLWVTAGNDDVAERGAFLASQNDECLQLITTSPYRALEEERAVDLVEKLALAMNQRMVNLKLPAWSDTMSRLPQLGDLGDTLYQSAITVNRYSVTG